MTYLEGADYFIYTMPFPPKIHSSVTPNPDGTFSMYLDSAKSRFEQIDDWDHEMQHIEDDDFFSDKPIEEIEDND